jgi:2-phospho-L-lactate guanylyltransferase (CobY/MobA/RfbA family)
MREEFFDMSWKDKLDEAVKAIKGVAESDMVKNITSKAQETATNLAQKAKAGVLNAADAFVAANADPSTVRIRYLNADLSIISPSDGLEIKRPQGGTLVIADGAGNGLVINASADKAYVAETVGTVTRLGANSYDLGTEDGVNLIVLQD